MYSLRSHLQALSISTQCLCEFLLNAYKIGTVNVLKERDSLISYYLVLWVGILCRRWHYLSHCRGHTARKSLCKNHKKKRLSFAPTRSGTVVPQDILYTSSSQSAKAVTLAHVVFISSSLLGKPRTSIVNEYKELSKVLLPNPSSLCLEGLLETL